MKWNFAPRTLNTETIIDQTVSKPLFFAKSGFPKTRDLSPVPPGGFIVPGMTPKHFLENPETLHKSGPGLMFMGVW